MTLLGLGHHFPRGPWLFRGLDHTFRPGLTAMIGPSGTGKSTLLHLLTGALRPVEGRVHWSDEKRFAFVHQTSHGVAGRSVRDHIALPLLVRGLSRVDAEAYADDLAARFNLAHLADAPYRQLSGGEAQRLMLAVALGQGVPTTLADEPTAALDAVNAGTVIDVLRYLGDGGRIVVIATHDHRVRAVCDDVLDLTLHS